MPVRNLTVLTRRPELSRAEFSRYWREVHGPMIQTLPGIRRYSQHHVVAEGTRAGHPTHDYGIDGFVDFLFDDPAAMGAAFDSERGRTVMADAANFVEHMRVYTVEERVLVDRTGER